MSDGVFSSYGRVIQVFDSGFRRHLHFSDILRGVLQKTLRKLEARSVCRKSVRSHR
jgi:hypothetical protein